MEVLNYQNFDIWIEKKTDGRYPVVVAPPSLDDDEYLRDDILSPEFSSLMESFDKNKSSREELERVGKHLFECLFRGRVLTRFHNVLGKVLEDDETGVRIRLFIKAPEIAVLPWELLYDQRRFLATWIKTPVVRYLRISEGNRKLTIKPPIKILVAIPSFSGLKTLDEERIVKSAFADLERKNLVKLVFMTDRVSHETIKNKLRDEGPFHVFHFIGHGCFKKDEDDGYLLVNRDPTGPDDVEFLVDVEKLEQLSAEEFADLFQNHLTMKLIVLNSCLGAKLSSVRPLSGVVPRLFGREIPAVVAMQYPVLDAAAARFAAEFYGSLCKGYQRGLVDVAVTNARNNMRSGKLRHDLSFAASVLFMRSDSGVIFHLPLDEPVNNSVRSVETADERPAPGGAGSLRTAFQAAASQIQLVSDAPRLTAVKEAQGKNIEVVEKLKSQATTIDEHKALDEELQAEKSEFEKLERQLSGVFKATARISRAALVLGAFIFFASTFGLFNVVGIDDTFQRVSSNYLRGELLGGRSFADDHIRVIVLDENTPPVNGVPSKNRIDDRRFHAEMIDALAQAGASVVAIDIYPNAESKDWDAGLADAIKRAEDLGTHVIIGTKGVTPSGQPMSNIPPVLREALGDKIGNVEAGRIFAGFVPAMKAVALGTEITEGPRAQMSDRNAAVAPSFVLQVIRYFRLPKDARAADISFDREARRVNLIGHNNDIGSIPVNDDAMLYYFSPANEDILAGVRRPYQQVYADLKKPGALDEFRNRIVMIGYRSDQDVHYVNGVRQMPGVEIQACVASNIFQRISLRRLSAVQNALIIVLMMGIGLLLQTKPMHRFSIKLRRFESPVLRRLITIPVPLLVVVALYLTAIYFIYSRTNWEIDMTYHIAALFAAYWFGNFLREKRYLAAKVQPKPEKPQTPQLLPHEEVAAGA